MLTGSLPDGPIDIISDVHGELAALRRLLARLGCAPERGTSERPIAFLGDLVDRGPDSPGVLRLVRGLCDAGLACMVLGNHEVNLLRGEQKEGNGWWFGHEDGRRFNGAWRAFPSAPIAEAERDEFESWLAAQPLVRERADLRLVHACWQPELVAALPDDVGLAEAADGFDASLRADFERRGLGGALADERARYGDLSDPDQGPDRRLPAHEAYVVAEHTGNPVRGLTCGLEHAVAPDDYVYLGGKWRVTARSPWWRDYTDAVPVVVGHYWRRRPPTDIDKPDLWSDVPPYAWAGPDVHEGGRVFCLDYAVGRRFLERWEGRSDATGFQTGLAAMRWPERTLVFDDREQPIPTTGFVAA